MDGDDASSLELLRVSAALSFKILGRVETAGAGSGFETIAGFTGVTGLVFDASSSVSDSSELDSSSLDVSVSSFLGTTGAAGCDDCKNLLWKGFFSGSIGGVVTVVTIGGDVILDLIGAISAGLASLELSDDELSLLERAVVCFCAVEVETLVCCC